MDRKEYNRLYSDARKKIKGTNCLFCGGECTSFCHSHSLPHMILENLKDTEPGTFFFLGGMKKNINLMFLEKK